MQSPLISRLLSDLSWSVGLDASPGTLQAQPTLPQVVPTASEDDLFSSGFFLRLGFSFIVGLAVGFALKIAFTISNKGSGSITGIFAQIVKNLH